MRLFLSPNLDKSDKNQYKYKLYHYVLMSNHVHLAMGTTQAGGELFQIMKGIEPLLRPTLQKEIRVYRSLLAGQV